ncbi:MAG: FG-GAP repeat domain-containing protein, partial [Myxococcota bacterium]
MRGVKFILLFSILLIFLSGYSDLYWNVFRADVHRTAMLTGSAEIDIPAVRWKYYAGGSLAAGQLLIDDINNDGALEYVLISGGKVLAKLYNDILIWDTSYIAAQRLIDIRDINMDGKKDIIVANSQGRIIILSASDGSIEYINSDTDFNWIGSVIIKDINKDGYDDIYVADTACGSATREPKAVYGTGIAYSFRNGFKDVEKLFILEPDTRDYRCGVNNMIADIDGDGIYEIIAPGDQYLYIYSAEDGRLKYSSPFLGAFPWGDTKIITRDVDNDGADEIFLYTNSIFARGSRRITALKVMDGFLTPIWQISPPEASFQRDGIYLMPDPLADFDSDGNYEFITSMYDSNTGKWTTYILDAGFVCSNVQKWDRFTTCYQSRVEIPNFRFYGSAEIYRNSKRQLLLYDYITGRYGIYELENNNGEYVLVVKSLFPSGLSYAAYSDLAAAVDQNYFDRLFLFDYQSDGQEEVVMRYGNNIEVYDVTGQTARRIGLIEGLPNISFTFYRPIYFNKKHLFVGHLNNGTVAIYDNLLNPVNDLDNDGVFDLRSGGYGANMLITDLEKDGRPEIFTTRSNGVISVLDGMTTDLVNPPRILWSRGGGLPTIGDMNADGKFEMVFGEFDGNNLVVNVLKPDLTKLYSGVIAPRTETDGFYRDLIYGNANGDNLPDIYYVYTDPYNNLAKYGILVWDGVSPAAQKKWAQEYGLPYQGDGQGYRTIIDSNGDGYEDYIINPYRQIRILNAIDGTLLVQSTNANVYAGAVSFFGDLIINHGGQ